MLLTRSLVTNGFQRAGWRGWTVAGPLHLRLQIRPHPKSVDTHDEENQQRSCRLFKRHGKNNLSVCLAWVSLQKISYVQFCIADASVPPFENEDTIINCSPRLNYCTRFLGSQQNVNYLKSGTSRTASGQAPYMVYITDFKSLPFATPVVSSRSVLRTEWISVESSDESRFCLGASDVRVFVRRRPWCACNICNQPTCVLHTLDLHLSSWSGEHFLMTA
ncbi:hypothetical protein TNCV_1801301 [Trichonephila clavipes]|nr:hypothetical protein TNCV_1801301 [Trichonephila clavipes]